MSHALAPLVPTRNQAVPIPDHDSWNVDVSSRWWLEHLLPSRAHAGAHELLHRVGAQAGSVALRAAADRANRHDPTMHDNDVTFDTSWDTCLETVTASGVCGLPWLDPDGGYLVRAAAMEQWSRLDIGVMCPVTMTSAAMPVLDRDAPPLARELHTAILDAARGDARRGRDGRHPMIGMAMTEPQGGSDLGDSTTVATPSGDGWHVLSGHKWFCSHPVSDALLVLARDTDTDGASATRGLSCFLVPGWLDDGTRNGVVLQRLKDKLGTRSLASAEVVLDGARGIRIGEPGRGVPTIMEMVVHTRMDCVIGSAGLIARAVSEVVQHARTRTAFGAPLVDQPLMRMVLADLMLEREGSLALAYDVALGFQRDDPSARLMTAAAKYWVTRRAVSAAIECVEALGGNGYTEEFVLARLYRDAQVNSTWEGSGNVMALDLLRALAKEPELATVAIGRVLELVDAAPADLAAAVTEFIATIAPPTAQHDARRFAGRLAVVQQAALLAYRAGVTGDEADAIVARAFVATRLEGTAERVFGDGDDRLLAATEPLLARWPEF